MTWILHEAEVDVWIELIELTWRPYKTATRKMLHLATSSSRQWVNKFVFITAQVYVVVIVQLLSHVWVIANPWTVACQASMTFTISWSLLKLMFIVSMMPSNPLTLCWPLLLLPSIFRSIRVFSNESVLRIRWPKDWSFNFSPSNEYSGLIPFRID